MWREFLGRVWPVGCVALPCGVMYCALLCSFAEQLEIIGNMGTLLGSYSGSGVPTLLGLTSLVLGWTSIVVLEIRLQMAGAMLFLIGLVCWVITIAGGFALALLVAGSLPANWTEMTVLCIVVAVISGGWKAADMF